MLDPLDLLLNASHCVRLISILALPSATGISIRNPSAFVESINIPIPLTANWWEFPITVGVLKSLVYLKNSSCYTDNYLP